MMTVRPEAEGERAEGAQVEVEDIYPLTAAQQGILHHALMSENSAVYRPSIQCEVTGLLDVERLERAWRALVVRHAALRTAVVWEEVDEPVQIVLFSVEAQLDRAPSDMPANEALDWLLREQNARLGDGSQAPLARLGVLRVRDEVWQLVCTFHHVILDGWSLGILMKELFALYALDTNAELSEPRASFADFVELHRRVDDRQSESYWRHYLKDYSGAARWAQAFGRAGEPEGVRLLEHQVARQETDRLLAFARQHGLTLSTLIQGAWSLLLSRYVGSEQVAFGTVVSGRSLPLAGIENLVGMCVNTVPTRVVVQPSESVVQFLLRIQAAAIEQRDYEQSSLSATRRWAGLGERDAVFDSLVAVENFPMQEVLDGTDVELRVDNVAIHEETNYALVLNVTQSRALVLSLRHRAESVGSADAALLLRRLSDLLQELARDPSRRVGSIPLLDAERTGVARALPSGPAPVSSRLVLQRFAEQVRRRGDAEALACGSERRSYRQLDEESRRWAQRLRQLGVRPEVRVGLCMDRGVSMITALLGILRAGGAYVPLDPAQPAQRLRFMARDADLSVLLTDSERASVWSNESFPVLVWENECTRLGSGSGQDHSHELHDANLAYVIYTSGSTGHPKGSLVSHGNLAALMAATDRHFSFSQHDVWTLFHSYGFDFSVWEIWGALVHGGRLVIVPARDSRASDLWYRLVSVEGVTVLNQTPSAFTAFQHEDERQRAELALRYVIFGGEALVPSALRRWVERRGDQSPELVNMYGITETTVHVTCRRISSRDLDGPGPIGVPLPGWGAHVLDAEQRPVPTAVKGELYISGAGVSRGYSGRPELTAQRFVPNPFGPGRLYRTGDLARWNPHGELEYCGRQDAQIKIRGYRIEPGEIESALCRLPNVRAGAVVVRQDAAGGPQLCAYVVLNPGERLTDIAAQLKASLPQYMIPHPIVALSELPLTTNGKLDVSRLVAPGEPSASPPDLTRTRTEEQVCRAVCETLGIGSCRTQDNFFDLGGHSLLATQLAGKLRRLFDLEIPLRWVFELPTLADICREIERLEPCDRKRVLPEPVVGDQPVPLSLAQTRLWVLHALTGRSSAYHIWTAVRLSGPLDVAALCQALDLLQRRHSILRTRFVERDGGVYQHACQTTFEVERQDFSAIPAEARMAHCERVVSEYAKRPFDLSSDLPWRALLASLGERDHVLMVAMHHIVSDERSMEVLVRELCELYDALERGESPSLPPLELQYRDYAVWNRAQHESGAFGHELEYWRKQLAGPPAPLAVPTDYRRPRTRSHAGDVLEQMLDADLCRGLAPMCEAHGVTLFMWFLAAMQTLLHRLTGQTDVCVGTPVANRSEPELERVVGCFVNTLVMRADLSGDPSFSEVLSRVKKVAIDAYSNQHVPFEQLVDELSAGRDASRTPLFDVMLVVRTIARSELGAGKLTLTELSFQRATAKFDLTVHVQPQPGGFLLQWEYNTDLFTRNTVQRFADQLERLLEAVVSEPTIRIGSLPLPIDEQRHELPHELEVAALPPPEERPHAGRAVRSPAEATVVQAMLAVLPGDDELGRDDDFFRRGGHSLSAIQLVGRLAEATGVELPVSAVFEAPTPALLAERLESGSERDRAAIVRRNAAVPIQLSFAQERMWLLEQLTPGQATYSVPMALRIVGAMEPRALQAALAALVERHEVLRTCYRNLDGSPAAVVTDTTLELRVVDVEVNADALDSCRRLMAREAERPIDLELAPVLRAVLYRLSPADQVLLVVVHHIAIDAWSVGNLIGELQALLSGQRSSSEVALPELTVQYADYAAWQRERLLSQKLREDLGYWREHLQGAPTLLGLRRDLEPAGASNAGGTVRFELDAALVDGLERLSAAQGATLYMTLLAVFQTLLFRQTDQETLLVGTPVANRVRPELEPLIGCFVNTLVMRADVDSSMTFECLLAQIRHNALAAFQHQELPFDRLVDDLMPERDQERMPLVQVMFVMQTAPAGAFELEGIRIEPVPVETGVARFDLALTLQRGDAGIAGVLEYRASWFQRETAQLWAAQFCALARECVAAPAQALSALCMGPVTEPVRSLTEAVPESRPVLQQIADWVDATPGAIAIETPTHALTYAEMARHTNQLANALRASGVGRERIVALAMPRGAEFVLAAVAVLKAGAAFLPIDPEAPPARQRRILEIAGCSLTLGSASVSTTLPVDGCSWSVDLEQWAFDDFATSPASEQPFAAGAAYVTFTSGSTGEPKGVVLTHAGLNNLVSAQRRAFQVDQRTRMLQFAALTFDAAVSEVFVCLAAGARLYLPAPDQVLAGELLHQVLLRNRISVVTLPPSVLAGLSPVGLDELKTVIAAGENCASDVMRRWMSRGRLINAYGPTETTVCASFSEVSSETLGSSIGRALPGCRLYLLDDELEPVARGARGEIFIAGVGVARGYLAHPEWTAAAFLPDPFSSLWGSRMYKTGDLARWLSNGELQFLGRADDQIKIRGFRIEVGEIEAVVRESARVHSAAVAVRGAGEQERLVCYFVPTSDEPPVEARELRDELASKLPGYMIPAAFVRLDELPLTRHGKLDRSALPAAAAVEEAEEQYLPPETETERRLARVLAEVLKLERVGRNDNFFALGGDSIMSIQVTARARSEGLEVSPKQILTQQVVHRIARVAETRSSTPLDGSTPASGEVELSPIQRWYFERAPGRAPRLHMAVLLELTPGVDAAALERAVRWVFSRHDALRLRFERRQGGWLQRYAEPSLVEGVFSKTSLPGAVFGGEALDEAVERAHSSIDIEAGRVFRCTLIEHATSPARRLSIVAHHLVVDAVSWRILLGDLSRAYEAFAAGAEPKDPGRSASFQAWAREQREYANTSSVLAELSYWDSELRRQVEPLPRERLGNDSGRDVATLRHQLSAAATGALLNLAGNRRESVVAQYLLAAWLKAVADWSRTRVLLVELEGHGREELSAYLPTERTVGWFTSLFSMAFELPLDGSPRQALQAVVREFARLPNKGIGFGLLRYMCEDVRVRERLLEPPQPELGFEYLGQFDNVLPSQALFRPASESAGLTYDPEIPRAHLLNLSALVLGGQLQLSWAYSPSLHEPSTMERIANATVGHLAELLSGAEEVGATEVSGVDEAVLARLAARGSVQAIYRLSPAQEGILFHVQEARVANVYEPCLMYTLEGELDVARLERSCRQVIARHDVLRTSFSSDAKDEPIQVVYEEVPFAIDVQDLRALEAHEREDWLRAHQQGTSRVGLDLEAAPLFRVSVLRTGAHQCRLVLLAHHLILDGWSLAILLKEILAGYADRPDMPSEPARLSFKSFVEYTWSRDRRDVEAFWSRYLSGYAPKYTLTECLARADAAEGCHVAGATLCAPLASALRTRARRGHYTLSTLLQAAWGVVVAQHSGQSDVVFGTTVSGRNSGMPGLVALVGMCINTLPTRFRLALAAPIDESLSRLHTEFSGLGDYEQSPLTWVRRASELPPGQPLFDSILVVENYPLDDTLRDPVDGVRIVDVRSTEVTNYPITVAVCVGDALEVELKTNGFPVEIAQQLVSHFVQILEHLSDPGCVRFEELPLTPTSVAPLLDDAWAPTGTGSFLGAFREQVRQRPHADALAWAEGRTSYAELDAASNRLAHELVSRGIRAEARVGVLMERSPETLVTILGVLKAGGAYVPLDPQCPAARLRRLLEAAAVQLVVVASEAPSGVAECVPLLCLANQRALILTRPNTWPEVSLESRNAAYVIFTSGSTGEPKGVIVEHAALANHVRWITSTFGLSEADTVLLKTPLSFDASVSELFPALASGARVVVAEPRGHLDSKYLVATIRQHRVSVLQVVPTLLRYLVLEPGFDECVSLRHVWCGGEVLTRDLAGSYHAVQRAPLHNFYGPTEACVDAGWEPSELPSESGAVPIGVPVAGARCYVLGEELQPLPPGTPGHLYLGGLGLARAYADHPQATACAFIPDPFTNEPGARMYRTGDVVRIGIEGKLEFLGRADRQVKLHGHRIEVGEIESALKELEAVHDALVVLREDRPEPPRLVAYVIPAVDDLTMDLREELSSLLPRAMVPARIVFLKSFPLTASGKLDQRALPAPSKASSSGETPLPVEELERKLTEIVADVLRVERVGLNDNFFALGGDSILSIQVSARARRHGLEISPTAILEAPTLGVLVGQVRSARRVVDQGPVQGELSLTPIQRRFFERGLETPSFFNMSVALSFSEAVDREALSRALLAVTNHHDALRLRFWRGSDGWQAEFRPPADHDPSLLRVHELLAPADEQAVARAQIALDLHRRIDLESGAVLRCALVAAAADEPEQLYVVAHHLVIDGVTWRILLEDLADAYAQARAGDSIVLPAKTASFQAWSRSLRAQADSEEVRQMVEYWLAAAEDADPRVPRDMTGANSVGSVDSVRVEWSAQDTRRILESLPEKYRMTIQEVLLAPFAVALCEWLDTKALYVDLEDHGRTALGSDPQLDVSRTAGWFTTLFPAQLRIPAGADLHAALRAVKTELRKIPGRGAAFGLARYLSQDPVLRERMSRVPEPELSFEYLGQFGGTASNGARAFAPTDAALGAGRSLEDIRDHVLGVGAAVFGGQLQMWWNYSRHLHQRSTIERLAQRYQQCIAEMLDGLDMAHRATVAADFPDVKLSSGELGRALTRVRRRSS